MKENDFVFNQSNMINHDKVGGLSQPPWVEVALLGLSACTVLTASTPEAQVQLSEKDQRKIGEKGVAFYQLCLRALNSGKNEESKTGRVNGAEEIKTWEDFGLKDYQLILGLVKTGGDWNPLRYTDGKDSYNLVPLADQEGIPTHALLLNLGTSRAELLALKRTADSNDLIGENSQGSPVLRVRSAWKPKEQGFQVNQNPEAEINKGNRGWRTLCQDQKINPEADSWAVLGIGRNPDNPQEYLVAYLNYPGRGKDQEKGESRNIGLGLIIPSNPFLLPQEEIVKPLITPASIPSASTREPTPTPTPTREPTLIPTLIPQEPSYGIGGEYPSELQEILEVKLQKDNLKQWLDFWSRAGLFNPDTDELRWKYYYQLNNQGKVDKDRIMVVLEGVKGRYQGMVITKPVDLSQTRGKEPGDLPTVWQNLPPDRELSKDPDDPARPLFIPFAGFMGLIFDFDLNTFTAKTEDGVEVYLDCFGRFQEQIPTPTPEPTPTSTPTPEPELVLLEQMPDIEGLEKYVGEDGIGRYRVMEGNPGEYYRSIYDENGKLLRKEPLKSGEITGYFKEDVYSVDKDGNHTEKIKGGIGLILPVIEKIMEQQLAEGKDVLCPLPVDPGENEGEILIGTIFSEGLGHYLILKTPPASSIIAPIISDQEYMLNSSAVRIRDYDGFTTFKVGDEFGFYIPRETYFFEIEQILPGVKLAQIPSGDISKVFNLIYEKGKIENSQIPEWKANILVQIQLPYSKNFTVNRALSVENSIVFMILEE